MLTIITILALTLYGASLLVILAMCFVAGEADRAVERRRDFYWQNQIHEP